MNKPQIDADEPRLGFLHAALEGKVISNAQLWSQAHDSTSIVLR
jgi:hypothetical protein